jgi:nucleotide-binding universal stress UspA family protein
VAHLLHDRFMRIDDERARDLATGNEVRLDALVEVAPAEGDASLRPVLEALDHGRDGYPRWVVAEARNGRQAMATIERVAAAAVRRGFVPISIEAFIRFREILQSELRDRSLLLAAPFGAA